MAKATYAESKTVESPTGATYTSNIFEREDKSRFVSWVLGTFKANRGETVQYTRAGRATGLNILHSDRFSPLGAQAFGVGF